MKYTIADQVLAQRTWDVKNPWRDLNSQDYARAKELGFIVSNMASNLCNDVRHGHGVETAFCCTTPEHPNGLCPWSP